MTPACIIVLPTITQLRRCTLQAALQAVDQDCLLLAAVIT
jgi:hypothetical protein